MQNYIPDGYTENGYLAERPGIYSEVRFTYRRLLHGSLAKVRDQMKGGFYESAKAIYPTLAKQIVSWDVRKVNPDGSDAGVLEIKEIEIARLAPQLIMGLFDIVGGFAASDPDPQAMPSTPKDDIDSLLENESAAERDAKN